MKHKRSVIRIVLVLSLLIYGLMAPMALAADAQSPSVHRNLNIDSVGLPVLSPAVHYQLLINNTDVYNPTVTDGLDLVITTYHLNDPIGYIYVNPLWTPIGFYKVISAMPAPTFTLDAEKTILMTYQSTSISGYVFNDTNGDGVWQQGEPGIPNAPVVLLGTQFREPLGDVTETVLLPGVLTPIMNGLTGGDGRYQFDNLPAGTFYVQATLPNGSVQESGAITIADTGNGLTAGQANFPQTVLPYTGR